MLPLVRGQGPGIRQLLRCKYRYHAQEMVPSPVVLLSNRSGQVGDPQNDDAAGRRQQNIFVMILNDIGRIDERHFAPQGTAREIKNRIWVCASPAIRCD